MLEDKKKDSTISGSVIKKQEINGIQFDIEYIDLRNDINVIKVEFNDNDKDIYEKYKKTTKKTTCFQI